MTVRPHHPVPAGLVNAELRPHQGARALAVVFALVCLVVSGIAVHWSDNLPRHLVVNAELGEPFVLGAGRVTVLDVDVATTLADRNGDPIARTSGVFVAVDVTLERLDDRTQPATSRLVAGERHYDPWDGLDITLVDVGYEATFRIITEVDPSDLADLSIEIYRTEIISGFGRRVQVPLELGRHLDQLLAAAQQHSVRQLRVEPVVVR